MKQADLADAAGISPSYLNLIEHDRRRIGGKILNDLARALGVDAVQLAAGAEAALIDRLRSSAAAAPETGAELPQAEEFAARFPGWAALLTATTDRNVALQMRVDALTDRLAHDPNLASSMHAVISAVTSIRATASILTNSGEIDRDWQARFHRNIYEDSQKLAEASRALTGFLEAPAGSRPSSLSPVEEAEGVLAGLGFHIPALEGETPTLTPEDAVAGIGPQGGATAALLIQLLQRYRADAMALPLDRFGAAARGARHEPAALAAAFSAPLPQVLRRLASLPEGEGHPPMGMVICDGAGAIRLMKETAGFTLPRGGSACSLWPVFQAISQPGLPIRTEVALPGEPQRRFLCYAIASVTVAADFDMPPVIEAVMLVLPDARATEGPGRPRPVGIACRICPREACPARREPSVLAELGRR